MRFSLAILIAALSSSAEAFAPAPFGLARTTTTTTSLFVRIDASTLIEEAREASKKYGPASPEARVAWEAVEEVDSADNSAVSKPGLSEEECELDENAMSSACQDYSSKIDELEALLEQQKPMMNNLAELAAQVNAVKLSIPEVKPAGEASPQLVEALKAAKSITEEMGADSPDARVAWDNVEEIAAAGNDNATGEILTDECLVESAKEACMALEELQRVLNLNKSSSRYSG